VSEVVANAPVLGRRSGLITLLLTYFGAVAGFAYVQRLAWGIVFALVPLALLFIGGRLGLTSSVGGFYAVMSLSFAWLIAGLVMAFRAARAMPAHTPARWYNRWYHYLWMAVLYAAVMNYAVRHRGPLFGYDMYRIPSTAMEPTLTIGDFVTADARGTTMARIHRGDIVTYVPTAHPEQTWVKRVIGLPGEHVVVKDNGVAIDGKPLAETWNTTREPIVPIVEAFGDVTLGADEFYLLGDNRPNSEDSRYTGPVRRSALRGKITTIWLHWSDARALDTSRIGPVAAAPSP
jgi:signal peptidase I